MLWKTLWENFRKSIFFIFYYECRKFILSAESLGLEPTAVSNVGRTFVDGRRKTKRLQEK